MRKLVYLLPALFLILAACSAAPDGARLPESPLLRTLERKSGRIAYISVDGNLYTIDQGGGNQKAITDDAKVSESEGALRFYQVPTWSWDSEQVAFISIDRTESSSPAASLYVANAESGEKQELYHSSSELPFYVYWADDNSNLSFLTSSTSNNLILRLVSLQGGESKIIDVGQPYYWSWAPDSQTMLVNVGGPAQSDPNAHLAFLHLSEEVQERRLEITPHNFQAPAWSPKGDQILLAAENEEGVGVLYLTDLQGAPIRGLANFQGQISFDWSPDGDRVAYIATGSSDPQESGKLKILALDESTEPLTSPEQGVAAFFWSPDSQKVAYLLPFTPQGAPEGTPQSGEAQGQQAQVVLLQLNILELGSGETRSIATFQPTQQFQLILGTFDQFQRSNTIWSPDSEYLVLSAINQEGAPGIWVVPASGRLPPRFITPGIIGFWSWK